MLVGLFFLSAVGVLFSYFIYPCILALMPRRRRLENDDVYSPEPKRVSLIVTAHNEAHRIKYKIENCLELEYPDLEIIVASDASDDETDQIVQSYRRSGVALVRTEVRKGKEYAQLQAIKAAKGDILVFSDVATSIPKEAIIRMTRYFDDRMVGAVSSEDRFVSRDGGIVGEGVYVRYEMWLRNLESQRAGLVGLSGSFFAARREICNDWDVDCPSDFNTALNCARQGLVAVTARDVHGHYQDVADEAKEYQRKVRTIIRGLTALTRHPEVLNPFRFGSFAFQVFGHKVMRWAVPWFQLLLLATSFALAGKGMVFSMALLLQLVFYGCVAIGHFTPSLRTHTLIKIPYFFVQVNMAVAHATGRFLSGHRMTVWAPSQR